MHQLILYAGTVFMGFFAIMNPIANTPVFLSLTSEDDSQTRKAVAAKGRIGLTTYSRTLVGYHDGVLPHLRCNLQLPINDGPLIRELVVNNNVYIVHVHMTHSERCRVSDRIG